MCLHEPDSGFVSIGFAAALILCRLRNAAQLGDDKQTEESGDKAPQDKQRQAQREYVEQRLREIAEFERRLRGK